MKREISFFLKIILNYFNKETDNKSKHGISNFW